MYTAHARHDKIIFPLIFDIFPTNNVELSPLFYGRIHHRSQRMVDTLTIHDDRYYHRHFKTRIIIPMCYVFSVLCYHMDMKRVFIQRQCTTKSTLLKCGATDEC